MPLKQTSLFFSWSWGFIDADGFIRTGWPGIPHACMTEVHIRIYKEACRTALPAPEEGGFFISPVSQQMLLHAFFQVLVRNHLPVFPQGGRTDFGKRD